MPPKKRKATSTAKASPAKKARTGPVTSEPANTPATVTLSPAGRPKRTSVSEPKYDFVRHRGGGRGQGQGRGRAQGRKVGRPSHAEVAAKAAAKKQKRSGKSHLIKMQYVV
jgi:hypothetical protein